MAPAPLSWFGIARLGLVQSSIGAVVMLASSVLNRIMVVEYATAAALPAGLVAFHYAVQLSRPKWGHGSDQGWRRTPWIIGGMAVLGLGGVLATHATTMLEGAFGAALALAIFAYALIGIGVGAAGTSLLALLASRTAEARRPAAASLTWIMMILGIVISATTVGNLIDPYTPERIRIIAVGLALAALAITTIAVMGVEGRAVVALEARPASASFGDAMRGIWNDALTRLFSIFVFVSMLAYSMQDLILEPFAGLVFGMSPGESTRLSGLQHGGVLVGMILVGVGGHAFGGRMGLRLKKWIVGGCIASAVALAGLAMAARVGPEWPLVPTVMLLGFANGIFAVAAIGSMLELAGRAGPDGKTAGHEGIRMGLWGAAQAMAFGLGGFFGAGMVDWGRSLIGADAPAFELVFAGEALLFLLAAAIAVQLNDRQTNESAQSTGVLA
jgi:BCD family chlorophyll transporter-like MFS transporter